MRVFISADIEGVTTSTTWNETDPAHPSYARHAEQMTREVVAACEGARDAGADEVVVKDAHAGGLNINGAMLPEYVTLLRGWSGHPLCMVEGIDDTFDACMFVGYHSAASRAGNPLAHTFSGRVAKLLINGRVASEFMLYSWAAAQTGVPAVFLSGDRALCEESAGLHPSLITVAVKDAAGGMTRNLSPAKTLPLIRERAAASLSQNLGAALALVKGPFNVELTYKEHAVAEKMSHFPGVTRASTHTLALVSESYFEVLRALNFIM